MVVQVAGGLYLTQLAQVVGQDGGRAQGGVKAARRSSSVGAAWLALAFCRSLRALITSCMAWLGMSASPLAWAC